jgi:hypothetical protein
MKRDEARQGPADVDHLFHRISAETARLRAGIVVALEALEAGDTWLACDLLLALIEDGPTLREAA